MPMKIHTYEVFLKNEHFFVELHHLRFSSHGQDRYLQHRGISIVYQTWHNGCTCAAVMLTCTEYYGGVINKLEQY